MSNTIGVLCLLILFVYLCTNVAANESSGHSERFSMIEIQWSHVAAAYTVSIWILIASAAKICEFELQNVNTNYNILIIC